jgi:hypothetical protein
MNLINKTMFLIKRENSASKEALGNRVAIAIG